MTSNQFYKSKRQKRLEINGTGCKLLGKRTLDPDATVSISKTTAVQKSIKKQNNFASKEIKNNTQSVLLPYETCPICCTEFKTIADLANHSCDRVLAYMKSCVVKLYNLPLVFSNKNSNACLVARSDDNFNSCLNCGNEYKTFVEYSEHPCKKILTDMQSCVVQLDERMALSVHTRGKLVFFECCHCKRVFHDENLVKQHTFYSAAKCNKNIKTFLLNINNDIPPTNVAKINVNSHALRSACNDSTTSASQTSLGLNFEDASNSKKNINPLGNNDITDKGDINTLTSPPYTTAATSEGSNSVSNALLSKPSFCCIT